MTTQTTHTPWHIELVETGVRWPCIYDGDERAIADVPILIAENINSGISITPDWHETDTAQEAMYIARLIAEAPAMKDLLEKIVAGYAADKALLARDVIAAASVLARVRGEEC